MNTDPLSTPSAILRPRPIFRLEHHRLVDVPFMADNMGGPLTAIGIVLHYTATRAGPATARALQHETMKASVHTVIDPDGSVIQQVPFDRIAWHAGKSMYKGRASCSEFFFGIEIANLGPLRDDRSTPFVEYNAQTAKPYPHMKPWTGGVYEGRHPDKFCPFQYWCEYTDAQMDSVAALCHLLVDTYKLSVITGHENVAPRRKIDPGPAFPWAALRADGLPVARECYDEDDPNGRPYN